MAVPNWTFLLEDLHGAILGEITDASSRQVVLPLNRLPTASFVVPSTHYLAKYFTDPTWEGLLKCYRNTTLAFHGPIVSGSEQSDPQRGQTVAVNAAGAMWRLQFRFLGQTQAGWSYGTATTTYDLGFIAQQMLSTANSITGLPSNLQAFGFTGISAGTTVASENGSAGPYWFKDVMSAIAELSTGINAFDFEVAPTEPTQVGQRWPQIGLLNCKPLIGVAQPEVIFEYGTTKANVAAYSNSLGRDKMMNLGYIQQPGVSDYSGILSANDSASITTRGVFEALADDGGVEWDALRTLLLNENIAVRKQPRQVVNFTPKINATPQPLVDYIVGDQVRCRIVVDGTTRLDNMLRVWGITFDIDNEGNEAPTLELLQP